MRDWSQALCASLVRNYLAKSKRLSETGRPTDATNVVLTEEEIDSIATEIMTKNIYKTGDGRAFFKLMKERTGFISTKYDCCPTSCVSYAEYPDLDDCPRCGLSRWVDPEAKTKVPAKTHVYFPIRHRLMLWYSSRYMANLLKTYRRKAIAGSLTKPDGTRKLTDVWSGKLYRALRVKGHFGQEQDLAFCCGFDGTKAFKSRKDRHVWPIILTCANLPPQIRFKRKNVLIVGFVPGPDGPKELDSFLKPLVDEFEMLSTDGIQDVWDASVEGNRFNGRRSYSFTLKAAIVLVATDMPARHKILHTMGLSSSSFCEYCQQRGLSYGGLHCPHKPPTNMPVELIREQDRRRNKGRVAYAYDRDYTDSNSILRDDKKFREVAEYMAVKRPDGSTYYTRNKDPSKAYFAEKTGISGKSIFMRLDTLFFPASFPPCTMHLFYENIAKNMFEHYAGRFFTERSAPETSTLGKKGDVDEQSEKSTSEDQPDTGQRKKSKKKAQKVSKPRKLPKFKRRKGTNAPFFDRRGVDPYNIPPNAWREIGRDTALSNRTYPDQLREEMTNLETTFRRMKAANWRRFLYHQSPIYFKRYLPKEHYDEWMNLVDAMRLATRKVLDTREVAEVCCPSDV